MIELILPWPPTVNHYKSIGRTVKTKSGKIYQTRVNSRQTLLFYSMVRMEVIKLTLFKQKETPLDSTIRLEAYVALYPPDKKRRDIDNNLKVIFDSLVRSGLIEDDVQICRLLVEKKSIISGGQVLVQLKEMV